MKKFLLGLFAIISTFAYTEEIDLWEESSPTVLMGYTGFEMGGKYYNKSIKNRNKIQKFLDEIYVVKNTVNNDLKLRSITDIQEKDWILNADISYLKYESLKTNIYHLNYNILDDVTRYGLNLSIFDGNNKFKEHNIKGGQINLYFNRIEEFSNLFGTVYIGKNKQEFEKSLGNIDHLYYGYFGGLEQKYENFDLDEFYSGYFLNLDISRIEANYNLIDDKKILKNEKNNDSIEAELGIFFEKKFYITMDTELLLKLKSSIGKEFRSKDKYEELGKNEFEIYNRNNLEIISKIGTSIDIFTGIEYKKSVMTSSSGNSIYTGFKVNF